MKIIILVISLLFLFGNSAFAAEQTDSEPYIVELTTDEEAAFDAAIDDAVASMSEEDLLRPYVILYKHDDRIRPRKILFLDGPARVDLSSNCRKLENDISRLVIVAPSDTSITFFDRYGRPSRPMRSGTWWGIGERRGNRVSQYDLKILGLHDTIVWFEIKRDGIKPNPNVQHPYC